MLSVNDSRRLSISHRRHALAVSIARNSNWTTYVFMLILFTVVFGWFFTLFVRGLFRTSSSTNILYVVPFLAFIILWYAVGLRIALWRSFGEEELVVENHGLHWTRKALFWVRSVEIPVTEIKDVRAITPWHSLSNHVEFTVRGRRHKVGDMLGRDEAVELSDELQKVVGRSH